MVHDTLTNNLINEVLHLLYFFIEGFKLLNQFFHFY